MVLLLLLVPPHMLPLATPHMVQPMLLRLWLMARQMVAMPVSSPWNGTGAGNELKCKPSKKGNQKMRPDHMASSQGQWERDV